LPSWKADLLTKAGRSILVQAVLTSMVVYLLLALDLPSGPLQAIDKIRRGFLWKGRKDVRGVHCLIVWPKVTQPPDWGGGARDFRPPEFGMDPAVKMVMA